MKQVFRLQTYLDTVRVHVRRKSSSNRAGVQCIHFIDTTHLANASQLEIQIYGGNEMNAFVSPPIENAFFPTQ